MSQAATWNVPQASDAPVSPTTYASRDKDCLDAILSSHSGASRPSYAVEGTIWKKTSGGLYLYNGTTDFLVGNLVGNRATAAVTGTTGATLTAAQLLSGVILRSGPTAGYADTFPTAALIKAALSGAEVGMGFEFTIVNTVAFANTVAAGTGITLAGTTAISASKSRRYLCTLTNVGSGTEAATITGISQGDN